LPFADRLLKSLLQSFVDRAPVIAVEDKLTASFAEPLAQRCIL
jgi:hypothetical protein